MCLLVSDEGMFLIFPSYSVPKLRYGPLTLNIKMRTTSHRIIQELPLIDTKMPNFTFLARFKPQM